MMNSPTMTLQSPALDHSPLHAHLRRVPQPRFRYDYSNFDDHRFYSAISATPTALLTEDDPTQPPFDDENQLPTPEEFKAIVDDYLNNLSPKKRDKALVDQHRYHLIQQVLRDPRNTAISTAQFRFWVKKMFQLQMGNMDIICHDNKPVAIKEHIYDILVRAHREAHHGGRDKTSALVRRKFSWIPKELVARFVRHCPFCITRRNGGQSPGTLKSSNASSPTRRGSTQRYDHPYNHHMTAPYAHSGSLFDQTPPIICTPSMREDTSDFSASSGPPSADHGYDHSPHYVAMPYQSSAHSPRRPSCHFAAYERDEDDFLSSYSYDPCHASSPHQMHPQLQHQQHQQHASSSPNQVRIPSVIPNQPQQLPLDMLAFRSPSPQNQLVDAATVAAAAAASLLPPPPQTHHGTPYSQPTPEHQHPHHQDTNSFFYQQHPYLYHPYTLDATPSAATSAADMSNASSATVHATTTATASVSVANGHDAATTGYYPNLLGVAAAACDPAAVGGAPTTAGGTHPISLTANEAYLRSTLAVSQTPTSSVASVDPTASSSTSTNGTSSTASSLHPSSTTSHESSSALSLLSHHQQQDAYFNADNNPLVNYANHIDASTTCNTFGTSHL